jgi:hypothetical protein
MDYINIPVYLEDKPLEERKCQACGSSEFRAIASKVDEKQYTAIPLAVCYHCKMIHSIQ